MKKNRFGARSRGLFVALVLSLAALTSTAVASGPAPTSSVANFEQKFMSRTIDHHFLGVQMAQLCTKRATDPLLRDTCQRTGASQAEQIPVLQQWLRDWYGRDEQPNLPPSGAATLRRLERKPNGERFDVAMAREFIRHHRRQIKESSKCVRTAYHAELRAMCQQQIETQSKDIQDFKTVLDHYGRDRGRGHARKQKH